jgi:hypothetical protein
MTALCAFKSLLWKPLLVLGSIVDSQSPAQIVLYTCLITFFSRTPLYHGQQSMASLNAINDEGYCLSIGELQ